MQMTVRAAIVCTKLCAAVEAVQPGADAVRESYQERKKLGIYEGA
jgi:hypothetical protein